MGSFYDFLGGLFPHTHTTFTTQTPIYKPREIKRKTQDQEDQAEEEEEEEEETSPALFFILLFLPL